MGLSVTVSNGFEKPFSFPTIPDTSGNTKGPKGILQIFLAFRIVLVDFSPSLPSTPSATQTMDLTPRELAKKEQFQRSWSFV